MMTTNATATGDTLASTITRGLCPDCGYRGFVVGPQGGKSTNIECANIDCRSRFNAAFFGGEAALVARIPRESAWPSEPRTAEDAGFSGGIRSAVRLVEDAGRQYRRAQIGLWTGAVLLALNVVLFALRLW